MNNVIVVVVICAAAGLLWVLLRRRQNVFQIAPNDPVLLEAQAEATAALPVFWACFDAPADGDAHFLVKAALPTPDGEAEHIWVAVHRRVGETVWGALENDPINLGVLKAGDGVEFNVACVEDWSFLRAGKVYGMFQNRRMLSQMPPAQANQLRQVLSEDPLPSLDHSAA